jgi:hypothetical protein
MRKLIVAAAVGAAFFSGTASAASVAFTQLTGITGGTTQGTAVYKADISTLLGNVASITIRDANVAGGSNGEFSGFDLDAIKLSTTDCATAACAQTAVGLNVFDFVAGTLFAPGTQVAPVDPKLFGTNAAGTGVNNAVATLGAFDAESIAGPGADGFISLGFNGILAFNLTAATPTTGLFLYIGEVGDNGEVAANNITISDRPAEIPEPSTYALMLAGLGLLGFMARRRRG